MTVCESEVLDPVKMSRAVFPPSGIYEVSFALSRSKCDRTIILREENQFSAAPRTESTSSERVSARQAGTSQVVLDSPSFIGATT